MKKFFRFFRGELNGWLINHVCTFLNRHILRMGMVDELAYHRNFQWLAPSMAGRYDTPMRENDIINLIKIGGLFQLRAFGDTSLGSIWFTNAMRSWEAPHPERTNVWISTDGDVIYRTERGFLDFRGGSPTEEHFVFRRLQHETFPTDINTYARAELRATYRERGAELIGYTWEGFNIFDDEGSLLEQNLFPAPPDPSLGLAYGEWYGFKYLHYQEFIQTYLPLEIEVFMLLFQAMQRIRRIGVNISSLIEITKLLTEDYVYEIELSQREHWRVVTYSLNNAAAVANPQRRYIAWLFVMRMKFKDFDFINRAVGP